MQTARNFAISGMNNECVLGHVAETSTNSRGNLNVQVKRGSIVDESLCL